MAKYGSFKYGKEKYGIESLWVYDRTLLDLINETPKAFLKYSDLQRIHKRIRELQSILSLEVTSDPNFSEWKDGETSINQNRFPHKSKMQSYYLTPLEEIYSKVDTSNLITPLFTTFENLTIEDVNNLEFLLKEIYYLIKDGE